MGKVIEQRGVVLAVRSQFYKQFPCFNWIACGQHQCEAVIGQRRYNRPGRTAGPENPRHSDQMRGREQRSQRLKKAGHIGVEPVQPPIKTGYHGVHRRHPRGERIKPAEQRHDRLLVRHGHIAPTPIWIGPARGKIVGQASSGDVAGAVIGSDAQLLQPEFMDHRRFGLRDRIADHFGVNHRGSSPQSRKAASTASNGIPSTVKWLPFIVSNRCTP